MIAETGIYMPEIIAIISDYAKTYAFSLFENYTRWGRAITIRENRFSFHMCFLPKFLYTGELAIIPKIIETSPGLACIEVYYRERDGLFRSRRLILNDLERDDKQQNCKNHAPWFEAMCDLIGQNERSNVWQKIWQAQDIFPGFNNAYDVMILDIRKWVTEVNLKTSCGHE